jgi:hypothetical protein
MTDLPTQRDFEDFSAWTGRDVLAPDGDRLGAVELIFLDEATDAPEWVLVRLEGADTASFVPLAGASVEDEAIRVEQHRERITAAPRLEVEDTLTVAECRRLYEHYGLAYSQEESPTVLPEGAAAEGAAQPTEQRPRLRKYVGTPAAAAAASSSESDADASSSERDADASSTETDARANTELGDSTTADADDAELSTADADADMPVTKGTGETSPTPDRIGSPPPVISPEGGSQSPTGDAEDSGGRLAVLKRRPALPITLAGGIAALIGVLVLRRRR